MEHKTTFLFFLLWPIVAVYLSFNFAVNALLSPVIFYGIPSILLSLLRPSAIKKSLFVSLFILPFMVIVDYIAEATQAWLWPLPQSMFPKLFNYVWVEVLVWVFLHIYIVIMFYQYFFEKHILKRFWDRKSEEVLLGTIFISVLFMLVLIVYPKALHIPYWYLVFGTLGILPAVIFEDLKYPMVFQKLLKTAMYFFYINFTYEITALKIGWWSFPSTQFIGYVSFFGVTFPFEEFFFWIVLFTLAALSYYEYFFNKEK